MTGRLEGPEGSFTYLLEKLYGAFMPNNNNVSISWEVARYLFYELRVLIGAGVGEDEIGNDLGFPGEVDNIGADTPAYRWAQGCIKFLKYLAAHLGPALEAARTQIDREAMERLLGELDENIDE